eukprot:gene11255-biopygen1823
MTKLTPDCPANRAEVEEETAPPASGPRLVRVRLPASRSAYAAISHSREKRLRTRPGCVRFFKFYRAGPGCVRGRFSKQQEFCGVWRRRQAPRFLPAWDGWGGGGGRGRGHACRQQALRSGAAAEAAARWAPFFDAFTPQY